MPDIQTELAKVIQSWEDPEPQSMETTMTTAKPVGVSEATFIIVRDQPNNRSSYYVEKLTELGYKKGSTTSLIAQMLRQGQLTRDPDGRLRALQTSYAPIKNMRLVKHKKVKAAAKDKSYKVITSAPSGIKALVPEHKEIDVVKDIMATISLPDAKRLFNTLSTYFNTL